MSRKHFHSGGIIMFSWGGVGDTLRHGWQTAAVHPKVNKQTHVSHFMHYRPALVRYWFLHSEPLLTGLIVSQGGRANVAHLHHCQRPYALIQCTFFTRRNQCLHPMNICHSSWGPKANTRGGFELWDSGNNSKQAKGQWWNNFLSVAVSNLNKSTSMRVCIVVVVE